MACEIIDMTVEQWIADHSEKPVTLMADASLTDVANALLTANSRDAYIIDDKQRIKGHLAFNKVINHLFTHVRPIHTHRQLFARVTEPTAAELMDPHFAYCRLDEALCDVIHRQLGRDVDDLVVVAQDNSLLGVVKLRELLIESLL